MKILFINPPYTNFEGIKESGGHMFPSSFGYLAAYARKKIPELESEIIKEIYPDTPVVAGGIHPTALPERTMYTLSLQNNLARVCSLPQSR